MNKYFLLILTLGILSLFNACDPNKNDVIVNSEPKKDTTNKPHVNDIDTRHEKYIIFPNLEKVEELKADTTKIIELNLNDYKKFILRIKNYNVNMKNENISHNGESSTINVYDSINYNVELKSIENHYFYSSDNTKNVLNIVFRPFRSFYSTVLLHIDFSFENQYVNLLTLNYDDSNSNYSTHSSSSDKYTTSMSNMHYTLMNDSTIQIKLNQEDLKKSFKTFTHSYSSSDMYANYISSDINRINDFPENAEFEFLLFK